MLTIKINTGHMLEWPPEADKMPVYAEVPAVIVEETIDIEGDGLRKFNDGYLLIHTKLVPVTGPEYDQAVAEAIRAAEARCDAAWAEYHAAEAAQPQLSEAEKAKQHDDFFAMLFGRS